MQNLHEILYEFRPVGNAVRVAAIDPRTGVEVQIFGPVGIGTTELKRVAARKLSRRLESLRGTSRR